MADRTCVVCFVALTGKQTAYCSMPCRNRGQADLVRASGARARYRRNASDVARDNQRRLNREYARRNYDPAKERLRRPPPMSERQRQARIKLRRAARGTTGGKIRWASGPCRRCGAQFVGQRNSAAVPAYCSQRCANQDRKSQRRAREAGAKLTKGRRWAVFERDAWTCRICGDPVNRDAVVPALDAPVIDHRVPLNVGGDHAEHNWQTAHFYCNSVKRDQVDFDFAA